MALGDFNLMPSFIATFGPMLSRQIENEVKDAYETMVDNWEQGRDATGQPWEPLSSATIESKGHGDPLIDTGEMIESAGYEYNRREDEGMIYVSDPKIAYHEYGTERIPARPVLTPTGRLIERSADEPVSKAIDQSYIRAAASGGLIMPVSKRR